MNVARRLPMSLEAFLAWEELQELRHEFDGFQPVAMTGGTLAHATIQSNLAISVGGRLRGTPCRYLGSDIKVLTATTSRYPDGLVTCTRGSNDITVAPDPVVIFEVLSRSTASTDHITKNREYASVSSVQRYVMLEQERIGATIFARSGADWIATCWPTTPCSPCPRSASSCPWPSSTRGWICPLPVGFLRTRTGLTRLL